MCYEDVTKVNWISAQCERHFLENGQQNICSCCIGDNLSDGGSDSADNQTNNPQRKMF